jgi:glutaredoxin
MLKEYFDSKNISFTEKLVDHDEAARNEMAQISGGFMGVPYTVINFDDGRKETVIGFDKGKLDQLIQ